MTFNRLADFTTLKSLLSVFAASLLLAACASDSDDEPEPAVRDSGSSGSSGASGAPSQPSTPTVTEDREAATYGQKNQSGLEFYANTDRIFFAYDSSELSSEARSTLARQAEWLNHYSDVRVTVEGHCDERGTREYNLALGDRRATAVKNYLVALGVRSARIGTISYGKERPAVAGSGQSIWSQNRRGVLKVQ